MTVKTYVYGVVESPEEGALDILGADGVSPVRLVASQGLGCVVSDHAIEEPHAMSRERLLGSLLAHQQVVESVMKSYAILPVQFGTLLEGPHQAREVLSQGHALFTQALASLRGLVEIEVAATWDVDNVLRAVGQGREVAEAWQSLALKGPPTLEERIGLGRLVKALVDRRRASHRGHMLSLLEPLALDTVDNVLVSDALVMNVGFLIERARLLEFEVAISSLESLYGGDLSFRMIGPLPPYSFKTVRVTPLPLASLWGACRELGLEAPGSEQEVKAAFRRRMGQAPISAEAEGALRQAYELLLGYCRSRPQAAGLPRQNGPEAGTLFTIEIKRARGSVAEPQNEVDLEPLTVGKG